MGAAPPRHDPRLTFVVIAGLTLAAAFAAILIGQFG